jgi:hypothetical protein
MKAYGGGRNKCSNTTVAHRYGMMYRKFGSIHHSISMRYYRILPLVSLLCYISFEIRKVSVNKLTYKYCHVFRGDYRRGMD